ncbi:hypothetical protein [Allorhizobium borbori]|uniref:Uncharacterized protein n=1 Tax=Allorhizobium borbori TaxID=485907 RepID=A0A7W6P1G5_9HYPH|nr:hypothetical protein [Allorhizobium borbori]MBB4103553.1 hypothetical protein [Allorhizobium borbori]
MMPLRTIAPRNIQATEDVIRAAQWLAERRGEAFGAAVSTVKARFGISAVEAADAIELALQMRTVRRAFG